MNKLDKTNYGGERTFAIIIGLLAAVVLLIIFLLFLRGVCSRGGNQLFFLALSSILILFNFFHNIENTHKHCIFKFSMHFFIVIYDKVNPMKINYYFKLWHHTYIKNLIHVIKNTQTKVNKKKNKLNQLVYLTLPKNKNLKTLNPFSPTPIFVVHKSPES